MSRVEYPFFQRYLELKGVFVGECIDRDERSSFQAKRKAAAAALHGRVIVP